MQTDIRPGSFAAWLAFTRPKTWGVAIAPVIASLSLAYYETGHFHGIVAFFTILIALIMQIISNMKNDLGYTERKAETGNRRGLPRATSMGWISTDTARKAIITAIVFGLIDTAILIYFGGWWFLFVGILSTVAAYAYMGGPKPIAYTPFGELTVLLFFGLTAVCGTYYLQTHTLTANAVLLSVGLGAIASAVLCVNNWRDRVHDRSIGRQTLAVVLSDTPFYTLFALLLFLPFLLSLIMVALEPGLWPILIVLAALTKVFPILREMKTLSHEELNTTMFGCVKLELIIALLFSLGALTAAVLK